MKRCPACQSAYADETLRFCRDDGALLVEDTTVSEASETLLLPRPRHTAELPTQHPEAPAASIAVLPFVNMSAEAENEYFCDGLAEEIINALSKTEGLKVAARTSAFAFRDKETNVQAIGRRLNVAAILEGSVRKSGARLRITVQLVSAADGFHLWSERYDRQYEDIFDIQDEITLAVMDALKVRLLGGEKASALRRYTNNTEAYELFLKGRYYYNKYTIEGWEQAIAYFERAIEKEPEYAPAYAGIGFCYGALWYNGCQPPHEIMPKWKAVAGRALEIDNQLAEAHATLASILFFYERDWEQAERAYARAVELNPNFADARWRRGLFMAAREWFEQSVAEGRRALELDPLSIPVNFFMGWIYWFADRMDDALVQVEEMIELEPEYHGAYWLLGAVYLTAGRYEDSVEALQKSLALGGNEIVLSYLACALKLSAREGEARSVLTQLLEARNQRYVAAINVARAYDGLGEADLAFEWLEKACEERNGELVYLKRESEIGTRDLWRGLRDHPRFQELLRRIGFPP